MATDEFSLTIAGIHYQANGKRKVIAAREEADFLGNTVLENLDIFLIQVANEFPRAIADGKGQRDQIYVRTKRRSLGERQNGTAYKNGRTQPKPSQLCPADNAHICRLVLLRHLVGIVDPTAHLLLTD